MATVPGRQVIPRPVGARAGLAPAWSVLHPERRRGITLARVRTALARAERLGAGSWGPSGQRATVADEPAQRLPAPGPRPSASAPRPSAVLVALFEEEGEARVVLTRRAAHLRTHTGEVAFPGGRLEAGEGPVEGALREAFEEVGLGPAQVQVIGRLTPLVTLSSSAGITPVVGVLRGRPRLVANPAEVDRVFDVSLAELTRDPVYREERWRLPDGAERPVHFFELDGDTVWGATARVLRELLDLALAEPPE